MYGASQPPMMMKTKMPTKPKMGKSKTPTLPHKMYKGKSVRTAKTEAEHNRLMKEGYTHTQPK